MEPWIKLCRKIRQWEWYSDGAVVRVFLELLLTANHKPTKWNGIVIDVGEVVTGRKELSKVLRLSEQQVRTALDKLERTKVISRKSTNRYTVIKVLNYTLYQGIDISEQPTSNQQATNKQPTNSQKSTNNQPAESQQSSGNQPTDNQQSTNKQPTNSQKSTTSKELENKDIYNNYIYNSDFVKVISLYEQNIGVPSPVARETLLELFSSHSADLVELAIEEAVKANARNIRYIEGIFRNWDNEGIKTVESAKLAIAEHRAKSGAVPKQSAVSAKPRKNSFQDYDDEITDFDKMIINRRLQKDYE